MKNNTLIRIKVPKALYESALKKALLEATDKAKTGVKEARHISDFLTLKPGREISKDTQRLGEKKKHIEEASLMDLVPFAIPLAGFLGLSVGIVKNMFKYMKDNNLKGMKGFIEAYNIVGKGVSGAADQAKGITEAKKKVDPKKAAEEKKKKEVEAKKAADKKKADAAKKK
jgi:hypothetical protein